MAWKCEFCDRAGVCDNCETCAEHCRAQAPNHLRLHAERLKNDVTLQKSDAVLPWERLSN